MTEPHGERVPRRRVEGLYAIVDVPRSTTNDLVGLTTALVAGGHGASVVQLRAKHETTDRRIALLSHMASACLPFGVLLVVNDDIDVALAGVPGLGGLHLGQDDIPEGGLAQVRERAARAGVELAIGVSTHDLAQIRRAANDGADHCGFGPVFATDSKRHADAVVGLSGLLEATRVVSVPVVAIGGLDEHRSCQAIGAGAAAVAMIGALIEGTLEAIEAKVRRIAAAIRRAAEPLSLDDVARLVPSIAREQLEVLAHHGDDLGVRLELGLPPRFAPFVRDGKVFYRPCDVVDLQIASGAMASPRDQAALVAVRSHKR